MEIDLLSRNPTRIAQKYHTANYKKNVGHCRGETERVPTLIYHHEATVHESQVNSSGGNSH